MSTLVNIFFQNAHTEQTVAHIAFRSRRHSSFNAMRPFFNRKQDKWIIGNQYGYLQAGDKYYFYYAGSDKDQAECRAREAYHLARMTLELETA